MNKVRQIRVLVRQIRWARKHGDVFGAYMLEARLHRVLGS